VILFVRFICHANLWIMLSELNELLMTIGIIIFIHSFV